MWQQLRLAVQEMNYATHRLVELQAPWIANEQKARSSQMPKWICKLIHEKDVCPFCSAAWCFRCDRHLNEAKEPCCAVLDKKKSLKIGF